MSMPKFSSAIDCLTSSANSIHRSWHRIQITDVRAASLHHQDQPLVDGNEHTPATEAWPQRVLASSPRLDVALYSRGPLTHECQNSAHGGLSGEIYPNSQNKLLPSLDGHRKEVADSRSQKQIWE
jgi:hypothetical protein